MTVFITDKAALLREYLEQGQVFDLLLDSRLVGTQLPIQYRGNMKLQMQINPNQIPPLDAGLTADAFQCKLPFGGIPCLVSLPLAGIYAVAKQGAICCWMESIPPELRKTTAPTAGWQQAKKPTEPAKPKRLRPAWMRIFEGGKVP
jgi:stringent starvation protein B